MNQWLRKCILTISSILLGITPAKQTFSCGFALESDDARFSLFRPATSNYSGMYPFSYAQSLLSLTEPDPEHTDRKHNCDEWQAITGKAVNTHDIYYTIYKLNTDDFLYSYHANEWDNHTDNTFIKWLRLPQNAQYLEYLAFSKRIEFLQLENGDPWNLKYEYNTGFSVLNDSLSEIAIDRCTTQKNSFLQQRYAFQAVKLLYYSSPPDMPNRDIESLQQLQACYDKYLLNKKTILSAWGLLYNALSINDKYKQDSCLLETYDRCEEKKIFIYNRLSRADINDFITKTKDPRMLSIAYTVKATKNPGKALNDIVKAYTYYPKNAYIPFLLSREINKLEDWIWTPQVLGFESLLKESFFSSQDSDNSGTYSKKYADYLIENKGKDKQYLEDVLAYISSIYKDRNANQTFLLLAAAHLNNIAGRYEQASAILSRMPHTNNIACLQQKEIEHIICVINTKDITNNDVKQELYQHLSTLKQLGVKQHERNYDYWWADAGVLETGDDFDELLLMISYAYKAKGDIVTAGLLYNKAGLLINAMDGSLYESDTLPQYNQIAFLDRNAAVEDIDKLIAFKNKRTKTDFEKLISPDIWPMEDLYRDLQTTLLVRERKYLRALAVANTIADSFWEQYYAYDDYLSENPITSLDNLLPEHVKPKKYPCTSKKLILKDIVNVTAALAKATTLDEKAILYYKLGCISYNISYFGKSWMMTSYSHSSNESMDDIKYPSGFYSSNEYTLFDQNKTARTPYYRLTEAINYYKAAYIHSGNNKELAARSLIMILHCMNTKMPYSMQKTPEYKKYHKLIDKYRYTHEWNTIGEGCPDIFGL